MHITKNHQGVYVAKIATDKGHRTINLQSGDRDEARRIAKETGLAEIELLAKTGKVRRDILAAVVLGRKIAADEAGREWREWLSTRVGEKQQHNLQLILSAFLRDTRSATRHVHLFTAKQVDGWVNDRSSEAKATTRALKLSALRQFFDFCSIRHYAAGNPCVELRVNMAILRHEQKETDIGRPFTEDQFNRVVAGYEDERRSMAAEVEEIQTRMAAALHVNPHAHLGAWKARLLQIQTGMKHNLFWRCAVQLGWHTGLRLGDICQLERASLEIPLRLVVWTDKTNARVVLRIKPALSHLLRSVPSKDPVWLFPGQREVYSDIRKRSRFSTDFSRFLTALGIAGRSFHDLRHAYASRATREGMPLEHIRQHLGHASTEMTSRYVHHLCGE